MSLFCEAYSSLCNLVAKNVLHVSPYSRPDSRLLLSICARKQLLSDALLRLLLMYNILLFWSEPSQCAHKLFVRFLHLSSADLVVPAKLVLPSAVLQLDAPTTLASFSHNNSPCSGDLFVRIRLGIIVLCIIPRWKIMDELSDTIEIAERGRRLHLVRRKEMWCEVG